MKTIKLFELAKETTSIAVKLFDIYMDRGDYIGISESIDMMARSLKWQENISGACYLRR